MSVPSSDYSNRSTSTAMTGLSSTCIDKTMKAETGKTVPQTIMQTNKQEWNQLLAMVNAAQTNQQLVQTTGAVPSAPLASVIDVQPAETNSTLPSAPDSNGSIASEMSPMLRTLSQYAAVLDEMLGRGETSQYRLVTRLMLPMNPGQLRELHDQLLTEIPQLQARDKKLSLKYTVVKVATVTCLVAWLILIIPGYATTDVDLKSRLLGGGWTLFFVACGCAYHFYKFHKQIQRTAYLHHNENDLILQQFFLMTEQLKQYQGVYTISEWEQKFSNTGQSKASAPDLPKIPQSTGTLKTPLLFSVH